MIFFFYVYRTIVSLLHYFTDDIHIEERYRHIFNCHWLICTEKISVIYFSFKILAGPFLCYAEYLNSSSLAVSTEVSPITNIVIFFYEKLVYKNYHQRNFSTRKSLVYKIHSFIHIGSLNTSTSYISKTITIVIIYLVDLIYWVSIVHV